MNAPLALIVDDEPDIRELLVMTLGQMQVDCHEAGDLASATALLGRQRYDLCLTDMRLPDGDGIDLVRAIQQQSPDLPVAVITAHGSVETAIEALKAGAFDFVSKPVDLTDLRAMVSSALKLSAQKPVAASRLVGRSPLMEQTRQTIAKLARSQAPVYISGESGTGKELAARMIHELGPRADKAFVPVNCGAIPQDLVESELFGHQKGSFTGAVADKQGLFQAADGGTLFLDEIADLPLHTQVKLLRAIQEKSVRPVGAHIEAAVDVRILSATHKSLAQEVEAGRLRQDLYYRINVIELQVPALRERSEDIPELVDYITARLAAQAGAGAVSVSEEAMDSLYRYAFPGNVRELENVLERAMTLCEGNVIRPADLSLPEGVDGDGPVERAVALDPLLDNVEKDTILKALEQTRWNKTAAARLLGISFSTLRYRMQKLGL